MQALSIHGALTKVAAAVRNGTLNVHILTESVRQAIVGANGRVDYVEVGYCTRYHHPLEGFCREK